MSLQGKSLQCSIVVRLLPSLFKDKSPLHGKASSTRISGVPHAGR